MPPPAVNFTDNMPTGIASWSWTCSGTGMTCPTASGTGAISFSNVNFPAPSSTRTLTYTVNAVVGSSGLPASIVKHGDGDEQRRPELGEQHRERQQRHDRA